MSCSFPSVGYVPKTNKVYEWFKTSTELRDYVTVLTELRDQHVKISKSSSKSNLE